MIVLLRNGRRKDEAKNELNVFLGDDSDSFVSWYFDMFFQLPSLGKVCGYINSFRDLFAF